MIKKLRIKLIATSMVSLFLVLFVIGGIVGIINHKKIVKDADRILEILEENEGTFPKMEPGEKKEGPPGMSAEIPYESRYFSVLFDANGTIILTDTSKIASVDTETAVNYASKVWNKKSEEGFQDNYRYRMYSSNGNVRIIFLDCRRQLNNFHNFLLTTFSVSGVGLLSVFILMLGLSARIVKPFSDNYEKQKRFITDAGHELKTPLTIIDADAEILEMDFGENYVSGPTNDGNGSLDYNGSAQITGGIFAASGSSGMAQNFDSSSTQGTIMVNIDGQEGNTEISLLDSSSTELLSWTAEKQYSSIIISTPEIQQGETYTITAGTADQSVTMDSLVYGSNAQGEMPGNGGERGDMKGGDMQGGPGKGQPDADMEKPQGSAPPDAPSGSK